MAEKLQKYRCGSDANATRPARTTRQRAAGDADPPTTTGSDGPNMSNEEMKADILLSLRGDIAEVIRDELKGALAEDFQAIRSELQAVGSEIANNSKAIQAEMDIIKTDVLDLQGGLSTWSDEVGIQNYSAATSCQSRPSKTRSDYGKLFVVLVIIGSICMVIITSGFIYICWQRRLPGMKSMFPAEELHSVENGYHDNPTLDVTNDSQAEMREKKPSTNGLTGAGEGGGDDSSRWQAFVNQAATEDDEEEQDTHL